MPKKYPRISGVARIQEKTMTEGKKILEFQVEIIHIFGGENFKFQVFRDLLTSKKSWSIESWKSRLKIYIRRRSQIRSLIEDGQLIPDVMKTIFRSLNSTKINSGV